MKTAFFLSLGVAVVAMAAPPTITLPASTHNYTVRLTLATLRTQPDYGGENAPEGAEFLVFGATWENIIDPAFAKERELPVSAKNDNLSDALTLVIDDASVVPVASHEVNTAGLDPNDSDVVGHSGGSTDSAYLRKVVGLKNADGKRSLVYYALDQPGAKVSGELLFAVPTTSWRKLELRYHDPIGGDCAVLLSGNMASATRSGVTAGDPPGAQANDIFVLAARLGENPAKMPGPPPPGRRYIAVDFQGRSRLKVQDQYPPYDPTHPPEAVFWRPDPADWGDFNDCLQLAADGQYPGIMDRASDVYEDVRFMPGTWTHHRLVFVVPAAARSLDLECFFNDYTIPGHDEKVAPPPMHFHLAGPSADPPPPPAASEKHIVDGPVVDDVVRHTTTRHFADLEAGPDEKFLAVDYVVRNTGQEWAEFHALEQLVWFNNGNETPPDDATTRGPLAPPSYIRLGAGEARAFQAVWRIPASLAKADMGLKGNAVAERFTLPLPVR